MSIEITDDTYAAIIASAPEPLLVVFMSSFCGPSHALFPVLDDMMEDSDGSFEYAEVDVEKCPRFTRACEVKGTPSMVWFHNGQPLGSRAGTMSDAYLAAFIKDMLSKSE